MGIGLYLDHHVPRSIANGLRLRGVEAVTAYREVTSLRLGRARRLRDAFRLKN